MSELEVDAQDVVRLMLQFCKENGLKVGPTLRAPRAPRARAAAKPPRAQEHAKNTHEHRGAASAYAATRAGAGELEDAAIRVPSRTQHGRER